MLFLASAKTSHEEFKPFNPPLRRPFDAELSILLLLHRYDGISKVPNLSCFVCTCTMSYEPISQVPSPKQHGKIDAKPILEVYLDSFIKLRHNFSLYTSGKTRHTPPQHPHSWRFFLISEREYLGYLTEHLLWSELAPGLCGVGNRGINIMNYVHLSVIYLLCSIAYVFGKTVVNPPGWEILGSIWSSSLSSTLFREEGSWE